MIREIEATQLDVIDPIVGRFREQSAEGTIPENFEEQLKDAVTKDRGCLYGCFDKDGSILGIGFFGKLSSRISFIYADNNLDFERELLNTIFNRFSKERTFLVTGGPWISDEMSQYVLDIGFMKFNRAYMTMPRTDVEILQEPTIPEGMKFDIYSSDMKDETADLMFKGNDGHVDQNVFPDFFGSPEDCQRLIENIEANRYGKYKESSSWILSENGKVIGVCFMTIRNGDTGYIPDIVIDPAYRRRGLGKAIQVHSMKRQIESEPSIIKMDLDVTLTTNFLGELWQENSL
jgi:ribosomal protein S18 acetylase RimI-like enzyme